jgi:hypothetical protein
LVSVLGLGWVGVRARVRVRVRVRVKVGVRVMVWHTQHTTFLSPTFSIFLSLSFILLSLCPSVSLAFSLPQENKSLFRPSLSLSLSLSLSFKTTNQNATQQHNATKHIAAHNTTQDRKKKLCHHPLSSLFYHTNFLLFVVVFFKL